MKDLLLTTALISLVAAAPIHAQTTTGNAVDGSTDGTAAAGTDATTGTDTATDPVTDPATDTTGTASATDTTATDMSTDMGSTAAITPPEGYTASDILALTTEDLEGATVYDANGESVGDITELVMAASGAAASTDMSANDTTGLDASGEAVGDTALTEGADATDGAAMPDAPTGSTTTDGTASGDSGAEVTMDGQVSHVVLDVGGFLGIGAHTVAVPIEALQVFQGTNEDIRVYLPWTQAQLEALPEYNPDDPSTLGSVGATGTMGTDMSGSGATDTTTGTSD